MYGKRFETFSSSYEEFIRNGSQIKILNFPQILMKISKYTSLAAKRALAHRRQRHNAAKGPKMADRVWKEANLLNES